MIQKKFKITNELGLHVRAAALLVKTASKFKSDVFVSNGKEKINGKSIMGVTILAAGKNSIITVTVNGEDEISAMDALEDLIVRRTFDEN